MKRVVVVGGGWAGCAASLMAAKAGAEVILLEKTDLLLGTGLVGGIMRNNGRFTATEEMIALGGGELFEACDRVATHRNIEFPDHKHATLYNVSLIEPEVRRILVEAGVKIQFQARVTGVKMEGGKVRAIQTKGAAPITADAFVDATGSAGPPGNCTKYGEGCVMCVLRCPTFGGRVSLAGLCGVQEAMSVSADGRVGALSGSCKLSKDSLEPWVLKELEEKGVVVLPIPETLQDSSKLGGKACQQYAGGAYAANAVILDTGHAKLMTSYMPLEKLHGIPGLEKARYIDPYSGSVHNSVRYLAMAPHDLALKVNGVENLFAGGEKAGPLVGHTEAMVTGTLAGYNAVRSAFGLAPLALPVSLAVGDAITLVTSNYDVPGGWAKKYTFSGSFYFERMRQLGLYTTDTAAIRERVRAAGLENVFARQATEAMVG
ncbi:MAG: FAD-dependent oxidoreductase [Bacillota bacterium]